MQMRDIIMGGHGHGHGAKKAEPLYDLSDEASAPDKELLRDVEGEDMRIVPEEHSGKNVMLFYTIFSVISFILLLVACFPVPLYKANNGDNWSIWEGSSSVKWTDSDCDHLKQIFIAIQAFAISAMIFALLNMVAAILQSVGRGHFGFTLLLGTVATGLSLSSWALMVHQFHRYNCYLEPVFAHQSKLHAAFALTITGFGLQVIGMIDVGYYFFSFYALSEFHQEEFKPLALFASLLSGIALIITCVGAAFPLWEHWSMLNAENYEWGYERVGLWHTENFDVIYNLPFITGNDDVCGTKALFSVGKAFAIISAIVIFVAFLGCLAAVYSSFMKFVALGASGISCFTLLILWASMVGLRYKKCNGVTLFEGYTSTEAMGMFTSAWVSMILVVVLLVLKI